MRTITVILVLASAWTLAAGNEWGDTNAIYSPELLSYDSTEITLTVLNQAEID